MDQRRFLALMALALPLLPACSSRNTETPEEPSVRKANVLLITMDTTRPDYLSCYNPKAVPTPNIDGLAARGTRFTQAVVQVPLTLPSHACILTGTYPQTHGIRDNGGFQLDPKVPTLAGILGKHGFETAAFVGAAILNHRYGLNQGFVIYDDNMRQTRRVEKLPGVLAEIPAQEVSDRALDWLELMHKRGAGRGGNPFFLWLHYYDPHVPYDPPEPFRARFRANPYAGEIAYTDTQIGRVLEWLRAKYIEDRTLVVLIGDHGESLGEHGEYTHGVFLYDSTIHVPLIMAGPGLPAGARVEQQVRSIDILPTVLDFLAAPDPGRIPGESLLPLLTSSHSVRTTYSYMETLYPRTAMAWSELRGVRTGDWKLVVAPKPELYQLTADPQESRNVIAQHAAETERLRKRVWEVAGDPSQIRPLRSSPLDDQTRKELESLGYVNASRKKEIRLDMSGPDPKDRVAVLEIMEKTAELINADRYAAAIPLLRPLLESDPQNPMVYTRLGLCYERLGQYAKAIEVRRVSIEKGADNSETHAELGELYVRLGRLDEAVAAMNRAAEMNPANLQNLTNLATAYLQLGKQADAERSIHGILAQNPKSAEGHNLLGLLELSRGRGEQARASFEMAIQEDSSLAEPYLNLGLLAEKTGNPTKAAECYEQFLRKASPDKHGEVIPKVKEALAELRE
ncbi:MAG: sulfatase-like hydrolase/transferase [Acidobacteriota bacterium]